MTERKLVIYIAMSVDGFIAADNDNLDFLSIVEEKGQDYGYAQFIQTVDTVIMGRKTYDKIISMGHSYPGTVRKIYVITRTSREDVGNVTFYTGDPKELVQRLKGEDGKNIYCDGGAEVVNTFLQDDLVDELTISIIPVLLGGGISLFKAGRAQVPLVLMGSEAFNKGLVQLRYMRK